MIVASGPSAGTVDLSLARGMARVIAINESWRLAPWADVLYGCDDAFWKQKQGVREFTGLRISQDASACARYAENPQLKLHRVICEKSTDNLILDRPGHIGWGGNSGLHAMNLAVQFGVKKIILVGYDMRLDRGLHWHGKHAAGMNNPIERNVERWRRAVDDTAPVLAKLGIDVINCSPVSMLKNFRKLSLTEALALPRMAESKPTPAVTSAMTILAIGPAYDDPSQIKNFGGVFSYYLRREFTAKGINVRTVERPKFEGQDHAFASLDLDGVDHIVVFGSKYFTRSPEHIARKLSKRIKGAVCQFHDSPIKIASADLTFACKGTGDRKNVIIGWAADPELCRPAQQKETLRILIDHPDYVKGRGDISDAIMSEAMRLERSSLWQRQFKRFAIEVLSSPKAEGNSAAPFTEMCAKYSAAHIFMVTHPEGVGLSVLEASMAGALPIVPKNFVPADLLKTIRRIEYSGEVPWLHVLTKIDPQASRVRALSQTWGAVADKIVTALREFRK